jgi:hypothetical protein
MDLERGERIALLLLGVVIAGAGLALLALRAMPLVVRIVLAIAPVTVGLSCCWAATLGWAEVGSRQRREQPTELLSIERLFLLPLVALALAALVGILADHDLVLIMRLLLALSTLVIIAVTGGLLIGRIHIPAPDLGRRADRPPPPPA